MRFLIPMVAAILVITSLFAAGCVSEAEYQAKVAEIQAQKAAAEAEAQAASTKAVELSAKVSELAESRRRLEEIAQNATDEATRAQALSQRATVDTELTKADETLEAVTSIREASEAFAAALDERLAKAEALKLEANSPDSSGNVITGLVGQIATVEGTGVLGGIITIGGLAWKLLKNRQAYGALVAEKSDLQTGLDKIVGSIDWLAENAPEVYAAFDKHAAGLNAIQGAAVKKLVDAAQSRNAVK